MAVRVGRAVMDLHAVAVLVALALASVLGVPMAVPVATIVGCKTSTTGD